MKKTRTLEFSIINIKLQPRTPDRTGKYIKLMKLAAENRQSVPVHGPRHGCINSAYIEERFEKEVVTGELVTFTNIDTDGAWHNVITGKEADPTAVEKVKDPLRNLQPDRKTFRYFFYPEDHVMIYLSKNRTSRLTPNQAVWLLKEVLNTEEMRAALQVRTIEVQAMTDAQQILDVFSEYKVNYLHVDFTKPNDSSSDIGKSIEEIFEEEHVKREEIKKWADETGSIQPNEQTKKLIEAGAKDGKVEIRAKDDDGEKKTFNTQKMPIVEQVQYSVDYPLFNFCFEKADKMLEKYVKKTNPK